MRNFLDNPIIIEDMDRIYHSRQTWDELDGKGIYITGAAGMIASYLVMFLIFLNEIKGYQIDIYAGIRNKAKAEMKFGKYVTKEYFHLYERDVTLPPEGIKNVTYIIHAASLASPQYYAKMPVETVLPNTVGTYELLEFARREKIKSFLFFSSGSVYGAVTEGKSISEDNIGKLKFKEISSFYGESKRCGETLCRAYYEEYGVSAKAARIFHTYGPTVDYLNDCRVFAEFVRNIIRRENIVLKSDGSAKIAFCYLTDTVSGLMTMLLDGAGGESYNVGNPHEYFSVGELAQKLTKVFSERDLSVIYEAREIKNYVASSEKRLIPLDTEKLESLEWKANISIEEGFYRTVKSLEFQEAD